MNNLSEEDIKYLMHLSMVQKYTNISNKRKKLLNKHIFKLIDYKEDKFNSDYKMKDNHKSLRKYKVHK